MKNICLILIAISSFGCYSETENLGQVVSEEVGVDPFVKKPTPLDSCHKPTTNSCHLTGEFHWHYEERFFPSNIFFQNCGPLPDGTMDASNTIIPCLNKTIVMQPEADGSCHQFIGLGGCALDDGDFANFSQSLVWDSKLDSANGIAYATVTGNGQIPCISSYTINVSR